MPQTKQPQCCARIAARLIMDQANLQRLAHRAAKRHERGLSTVALEQAIALAKTHIAQDEASIVDHEAAHAGGLL